MLLVNKFFSIALFGVTPIVVSATTITTLYKSSDYSNDVQVKKQEETEKYYKNNCFILENASNDKQKLLTCNNLVEGNYYFYNSEHNIPFLKVKSLKVKDDVTILLVLEENGMDKSQTLAISGSEWKNFPKGKELINNQDISCSSSSSTWSSNQLSWTCTMSKPNFQTFTPSKLSIFKKQ